MTPHELQELRDKVRHLDLRSFMDRRYKRERVALISAKLDVIEIDNLHPDPQNHFGITEAQVLDTFGSTHRDWWWGVMHTHPFGSAKQPSSSDLVKSPYDLYGLVLHVASGTRTLYRSGEVILTTTINNRK